MTLFLSAAVTESMTAGNKGPTYPFGSTDGADGSVGVIGADIER